ncbi:MAG TPA: type II toxin-antitoxin system Phd/YefM family antitoxin [Candidatus Avalokitesvara rifleensis]|uniref:type II toxin-antitoxin system Phd/YefM family antitoxin n=1 Tax=Candidatus Avalokitesvara rifleensis TaxID=3367620 RepID=UPI00402A5141
MPISPKDIIPLTKARAKLTELCEQIRQEHGEKIITKNGESCAALIDSNRLEHYHRLEREHIHLTLLEEAIRGLEDTSAGKTVSLKKLKARYGQ